MTSYDDNAASGGIDIAVIGFSCRVPGAQNAAAFWENILRGHEAVSWLDRPVSAPPSDGMSHHVPAAFLLDQADCFDAPFFGMSPREAALTDPQHRVLLECAYEALEHAGHAAVQGQNVGVYMGCGPNTYLLNNVLTNPKVRAEATPLQILIGNEKDYLASRISYKLDLRGPSMVVQSACSTSLLAVHVAGMALFAGECDMALAGGVSFEFPQDQGYVHQQGGILSPDGHCRPFSAQAGGTVRGNGAGIVVLKRLADAQADGDAIYAVIRGSATNNDGAAKVGYAAPSIDGQAAVIRGALEVANAAPDSVSYVEAHGTGTALGDPVEVAALAQAFGAPVGAAPRVLGAVKANIGHLDAAAGVAGLIKAALALHHETIPPTLHFDAPHPAIDFSGAGFMPANRAIDWARGPAPRRAAVSSFGIGGSNVHAVLEEAPAQDDNREAPAGPFMLRMSALNATAVKESARRLGEHLASTPQLRLDDVAFTLRHGRRDFAQRLAVVASSTEHAAHLLQHGGAADMARGAAISHARTVFMFPGQGTQYPGMGAEYYVAGSVYAAQVRHCCDILRPLLDLDLLALLYPDTAEDYPRAQALLAETRLTQPALFVVEYALACQWMAWGLQPDAMIGHSIGEYVAACLASVLDLDDALRLVAARGRLMQSMDKGSMLAVNALFADIASELGDAVALAAINRPQVCVLSGPDDAIADVQARLTARGIECQPLATSHAFHSAMMAPCCPDFQAEAGRAQLRVPQIPFISCLTGEWISAEQATSPAYWADSLRGTVRFADGVRNIADSGAHIFLECGPGRSLSAAVRDIASGRADIAQVPLMAAKDVALDASLHAARVRAQLWCLGTDLDAGVPAVGRRVALPAYPFERKRHWIEPGVAVEMRAGEDQTQADTAPDQALSTDQRLARLWCDALGVDAVSMNDNFFALGGDSILSIQIAHQARGVGISLQPRMILSHPTIAQLMAALDAAGPGQHSAAADAAEQAGQAAIAAALVHHREQAFEPFPLTDIQHAYWVGRNTATGGNLVAAHAYEEFDCPALDVARLQKALRGLIARHPMMRAVITPEGMQRILPQVPDYVIAVNDFTNLASEQAEQRLAALRQTKSHQVMDCERWPLFEVSVSQLADNQARLHISFDLLITDAWSITIFWHELERRYLEPDYDPAPLPVSFRDYVLAEIALESGPSFQRARDYWLARADDFPNAPSLPLLCAPDTLTDVHFVRREARIGADLWKRLRQRAADSGTTPSILLCAAYADTLAAWSESPRFCLNLPAFSRLPVHEEIGEVMGDFTSVLLLEVDCSADLPFEQRAKAVQQRLWDDIAALQFSGVKLLRAIAASRGTQPAMPYVFTSLIFPTAANRSVVGTLGRLVEGISQTPQVWLDCQLYEDGQDLMINWDSIQALFDPAMLDAMFAEYIGLLERLASEPEAWSSTSWRDQRAARQIGSARKAANQTGRVHDEVLLHAGFARQAKATPDALALVADGVRLHYAELDMGARWVAASLTAQGAQAGDRIAVVLPKGWEQVVAVLGILRAGMCYVPVDPALPRERAHTLFGIAHAAHAVTSPELTAELMWPDDCKALPLDRSALQPGAIADSWTDPAVDPDAMAYIIFTSGTTGVPKGVMTRHRAAANTVEDINNRFAVTARDRIFGISSLSFDLSVYDIFGTFAAGAALVLPPAAQAGDPACWEQLVRQEGVSVWNSVPALMDLLVSQVELTRAPVLAGLRVVMMSGDWIPLTLPARIARVAPGALRVSLGGATEASIWSISYVIDEVDPGWRSIPYGSALANQTFDVLDAHLRPRPDMVAGELYIGGIGLADGYVGNADETAHRFVPHPSGQGRLYRTGDMGRWRADGQIEFLGRQDSQVKINGFRVEIGEIEKVACDLADVASCAVQMAPDQNGARRLVAYACPVPGKDLEGDAIRSQLAAKLPAYMVPSVILVLPELPLSANGKIDRARLPAANDCRVTPARQLAATPTEQALHALWGGILGHTDFGVTDTFFETGGDSRQLTELVTRIRTSLQPGFPLRDVFLAPNVRALAVAIDDSRGKSALAALPGPGPSTSTDALVPMMAAQARLWFHHQMVPQNSTYNIVEPFHLRGELDAAALQKAFATFAQRHDALSMAFRDEGTTPCQVRNGSVPIDFQLVTMDADDTREAARHAIDFEANTPFMLDQGPHLRVRLLRFGPREHTLIVAVHHIVWDGWSTAIMVREVGALYRGGNQLALPPLQVRYADVALWEQSQTASGKFRGQLEYWWRQLATPLPVLALPTEGEISEDDEISGERVPFAIDAGTAARFRQVCNTQGASVFMGYLAAWTVLLQWWCRQDDIIVGVPAGHRAYPQLADTVGFLVNSLAIRTGFQGDPSFSAVLSQVRDTAIEAYAHQDVPFDQVVEAVNPQRRTGESAPLFRSWFVLHDVPLPDWDLPGIEAELLEANFLLSVHDIKLSLVVKDGAMEGGIDFRTGLFSSATIARLADCLVQLVTLVAAQPDLTLHALNRTLENRWDGKDAAPAKPAWNAVRSRRVAVKQG
ncbi:hybrid non-ribosomal peptide synthetase/type I polyketide synthase [Massilia sp. CF038]|uniref:hybrid non-ribosomal peptide synthetase/type I polyketide synthase n=1 Tax=Massilia sp. CF038 TaxID=1881045 RepID=UPI000918CBC6|nr:hybrid non-ribosomal peptide synthetase/type I polyketide synthase [Massilia sp. CF038]SHG61274.1 amino acid adenylation domain-containing protein [Massilia sp. CF038]